MRIVLIRPNLKEYLVLLRKKLKKSKLLRRNRLPSQKINSKSMLTTKIRRSQMKSRKRKLLKKCPSIMIDGVLK